MQDLLLLDCTLRDGGYINDWNWGFDNCKSIIRLLVKGGVDIVEVGFLRNVSSYSKDINVCNNIGDLNKLLPSYVGKTMFSAMAMRSNYDIDKLEPYSGDGIELIRVTAHDYDIDEGLVFAEKVKEKGYKVSINPINIMGYSDEKLLEILKKVNEIQPYQFAIVDTFGSMRRRDLDRIVNLVDHNLSPSIRVALHLHENMSLSFSLAQMFIDKHLRRPVSIDGSLMGMGRVPGNLPLELIADYLNEYGDKFYDIDFFMDAIQEYIEPIKRVCGWGYMPTYFLSARFNVHRNYAEHYLEKGDLSNRDINRLLSMISESKATVFDSSYADELYYTYKNCTVDDSDALNCLRGDIQKKKVLVIAPGKSIIDNKQIIEEFIENEHPVIISVNFVPDMYKVDYCFVSNGKRYAQINGDECKLIVTSNIKDANEKYVFDYHRLGNTFKQGYNSLIMALSLLKEINAEEVSIVGADGYVENGVNYYKDGLKSTTKHSSDYNEYVARAIRNIGINVKFLTPTKYEI